MEARATGYPSDGKATQALEASELLALELATLTAVAMVTSVLVAALKAGVKVALREKRRPWNQL